MTPAELLTDALERVRDGVADAVEGLTTDQLAVRPDGRGNSMAWLVWHLTRVQDDHVADVAGHEQVWTADGYADRFGLPFDADDTGYGHSAEEMAHVRASADDLLAYARATHDRTVAWLATTGPDDLDRVVDERWDPPVTLGVRLVSVVNDATQHLGQAAYVRGLVVR
ncbi:DinB family protein [Nocardioides sp. SYSU D00038]|uniref:mycothiol transferase n=1 Tax=Nocardioides sp. SYSU D00038 TaxID=2812554 RepID=UPI0019675FF4|nr:DinB family protein [Nocardioides sp. SYSU D00038]